VTSQVEVYADLWCPFAYVGLVAALDVRDRRAPSSAIAMRAWPLELVNGTPLDPETTAAHIDDLRSQVAQRLFGGFNADHFPTSSLDALSLVAHASARDLAKGEALAMELRTMLFEEGLDISDDVVLAEVATSHDLAPELMKDHDLVEEQWHEGVARGVKGSPHFFAGTSNLFCPLLDIERDEAGHLHIETQVEELEGFLAQAWTR
jgi:predicted DsbA family dithiol-disulfide isomerase